MRGVVESDGRSLPQQAPDNDGVIPMRGTYSRTLLWLCAVPAAAVAIAMGAGACGEPTSFVCTSAGCQDGLALHFGPEVPDSLHIEVTAGDGTQRTADCFGCPSIGFDGFYPEYVTIRLSWDNETISMSYWPTYAVHQPNGPDCPPTCRGSLLIIRF
jgi:hypothetical protein